MRALFVGLLTVLVIAALFEFTDAPTDTARAAPMASTTIAQNIIASASTTVQVISDIVTPPRSGWKRAIATVFWVGEAASEENGFIHNRSSAWDASWLEHYGGVDDPLERCGNEPCDFVAKENPFYVALPYNDLDETGRPKESAARIPWYEKSQKSILKNRWVEVRFQGKECFGQWEDVGPFNEDDIEYVFGDANTPLNTDGEKAGIDLSPAMSDCLGIDGSEEVQWRHVAGENVPAGPWRKTVTTRQSQ